MDELLQKAMARRAALRRELEAVESFIQSYTDAMEVAAKAERDLFQPEDPPSKRASRRKRATDIALAMDDAERLILEAGEPLTRSTLLAKLIEQGHQIEGSDKSKVLGTNLWRSRRFHNLKGAGYWPLSHPIPPAFRRLKARPSMLLDADDPEEAKG